MSTAQTAIFFYFPTVVNAWTARMVALQVVFWSTVILLFDFCAGCTLYRVLAQIGLFCPEICVNCSLGREHEHPQRSEE